MKRVLTILLLLVSASVSPLIFPIAESGRSSMDVLAKLALLPAAGLLLITLGMLYRFDESLARASAVGLAAGAVATVALEAIRLPGFWLGFMPGNLPRLMGVLLLNQFASGPSMKSRRRRLGLSFLEWRQLWSDLRAGFWKPSTLDGSCVWRTARFGFHVQPRRLGFGRRLYGAGFFHRIPLDGHVCTRSFRSRIGLAHRRVAGFCR